MDDYEKIEDLRQEWREVSTALKVVDRYLKTRMDSDLGQVRRFRDALIKRRCDIETEALKYKGSSQKKC